MGAHAKLSPSSAHRWLECPGSVRLTSEMEKAGVVEGSSVYADEGTMAHTIAEIGASYAFGLIDKTEHVGRVRDWRNTTPDGYHEEMVECAAAYVDLLRRLAAEFPHTQVMLEQKVDTGITASWGTLDAAMVSGTHLHVVDYKYGKGIPVDAAENPQLMLYALGGLDLFELLGDIETVTMTVHQPRLDSISHYAMKVKDLKMWREAVARPAAALALSDDAYLSPSDTACRFCPAAGQCRARVEYMTRRDFGNPDLLSPAEIGEILGVLPDIRNWAKAVEENALHLAYNDGVKIPGWKCVRSGGQRQFKDQEQAFDVLREAGYEEGQYMRRSLQTLSKLDKMVGGKDELQRLMGPLLGRSEGRESLVPEEDERDEVSALRDAKEDFS